MDAKERLLIEQLHSTILSGSFAERDILALLIVLRNHAKKDTLVREFGDFVAHRERDQGIFLRYLQSVQSALHGGSVGTGEPVFTVSSSEDVRRSFNEVFRSLRLSELDTEQANQITVCIISLLQSVEIKAGLATSVPKLLVGITYEYIALLGQGRLPAGHVVVFPMLVAQNKYVGLPSSVTAYMILDRVIEACATNEGFRFAQLPSAA